MKLNITIWITYSLVVACLVSNKCQVEATFNSIFWELKTDPAVFGQTIQLICRLTVNQTLPKLTWQWFGGHDLNLLTRDEYSTNKSKYSVSIVHNTISILTINNLDIEDVNVSYKCGYGFEYYTTTLDISNKFEYHPTEMLPNNVTVDEMCNVFVNVTLQKVFPQPICKGYIGLTQMMSGIEVATLKLGLLFTSEISMYLKREDTENKHLFISCLIGGLNITVINQTIGCPLDVNESLASKQMIGGVAGGLVAVLKGILCFVIIKRKHGTRRYNNAAQEQLDSRVNRENPEEEPL